MEIVNYKEQPKDSYAIATFDIYFGPIWGMTLRKWKVCRSKKGHLFLKGPCYKAGEFEGKPKFEDYADFTSEKWKEFSSNVMALVKPFLTGE